MKFKCYNCSLVVDQSPCPVCNSKDVEVMCEDDHCHCEHEIISGLAFCEKCGQPMCPICHSHDVIQISRVTGYLSTVSGWNRGKQQELKDRLHYDLPA